MGHSVLTWSLENCRTRLEKKQEPRGLQMVLVATDADVFWREEGMT